MLKLKKLQTEVTIKYAENPQLPFMAVGLLEGDPDSWHDEYWAIDADKKCWHGKMHYMALVSQVELLAACTFAEKLIVHKVLGTEPSLPDWVHTALDNGWSPPTGWNP